MRFSLLVFILLLGFRAFATVVASDDSPLHASPPTRQHTPIKVPVRKRVIYSVGELSPLPIQTTKLTVRAWANRLPNGLDLPNDSTDLTPSLLTNRKVKPFVGPDPIRFTMQASKGLVEIGEEFEITITAELLPISPSQLFFFESQRSFSLKLLMPEEFVQTGGTYYDLVNGTLSADGVNKISYSLRGRMVSPTKGCFRLLRGNINSTDQSLYIEKGGICIPYKNYDAIPSSSTDSLLLPTSPQARLQASTSSCNTPEVGWKGDLPKSVMTFVWGVVLVQPLLL